MKRIAISVSNDLFSDQRVKKTCQSLKMMGFEITLVGRLLNDSQPINDGHYEIKRMKLSFIKGPFFYANLNIRLFLFLLFHKADLLLANDLDTLLANYLISKIKRIPLVYDSHEYFTEVPELQGRFSKKVWEKIEKFIFPRLKDVFTVNDSIAQIYQKKYGVKVQTIKNFPNRNTQFTPLSRAELRIGNEPYIILQGAGINIDRGSEELVLAMEFVSNVKLYIIGSGDVIPKLKQMVIVNNLMNKIAFIEKKKPEILKSYTFHAELGITLDKDTNLNYRYSLPNKIFDYIQAGIPVLSSDLPEVKQVVLDNNIGIISPSHAPIDIAASINRMIGEDFKLNHAEELSNAANLLCWENQENLLQQVYQKFL